MKHLFVPYEIALLAKEKGFNEECLAKYDNYPNHGIDFIWEEKYPETYITKDVLQTSELLAPLYQQLVDWFREKEIYITIECDYDKSAGYNRGFTPVVNGTYHFYDGDCFIEYYNAVSIAITEAFKLINP